MWTSVQAQSNTAWEAIAVDTVSAGGPYIYGAGYGFLAANGRETYLSKYDASGNHIWSSTPAVSGADDALFAVGVNKQGEVFVAGTTGYSGTVNVDEPPTGSNGMIYLSKINTTTGAPIWATSYKGPGHI